MGEQQEESKEAKAADSFVNDVSEAEGRQEPTVQSEKEEQQEETKDEKAADSFVNDISEAEGRQETTVQSEKEEELEETNETNNEVTEGEKGIFKLKKDLETEDQGSESPIEIIGEIKDLENSEEKENEKEQGTEEGKTLDSFVNEISESEGRQEPTV